MQLVARVRRRAWLNGQLIEDVVTDDVDEDEDEALAAADEDGDEGGDWEADVLDDDVRGAGAGGRVGCCRCVEQSWGEVTGQARAPGWHGTLRNLGCALPCLLLGGQQVADMPAPLPHSLCVPPCSRWLAAPARWP